MAVTGIILFAVSFDTITPHEYGVRYSTYSHRVDQETYDNGRYLLGIGHYFFKYPRRLVYTEFSGASDTNPPVSVWSNDGQSLDVEGAACCLLTRLHGAHAPAARVPSCSGLLLPDPPRKLDDRVQQLQDQLARSV